MKKPVRHHVYEPWMAANQVKHVTDALNRNELTFRGSYVPRFEQMLGERLGAENVVATTSGTTALYAAYRCVFPAWCGLLGCPMNHPRRRVAAPTMTYAATVSQLILAGYEPAYYDCGDDFQADVDSFREAVSQPGVVGAVVAPLYTDAPDMGALREICDERNVPLVVDAAEAFLCRQGGREVGSYGRCATYSFFANKVMTTGEGGCVTTDDAELAAKVDGFCNHNTPGGYWHDGPGTNFRLTNLQAALGVAQLEEVDLVVARKRHVARYYREHLKFEPLVPNRVEESSEWMPVWRLPDYSYEEFRLHCESRGVEVRPAFYPVHTMPGFGGLKTRDRYLAESLPGRHFMLPCHPALSPENLSEIVGVVNSFRAA